jgi:hypothetical protein
MNNLSHLASSCEYLTNDKLCLAVCESEKAKAARQVRCKNSEKMTCCYLCMFVLDCETPCRFLGNSENESQQIDVERDPIKSSISNDTLEENKTENNPVSFCSLCNVVMSQTLTRFKIEGGKGQTQNICEEFMPVIVCICPKCGKIDLRSEEKANKN